MARSFFRLATFAGAMLAAATALAAGPGNDPRLNQRLETALGTYVISQLDRSVLLSRTMPSMEKPAKPVVDDGEAVEVGEDVYVERQLVPRGPAPRGEDAVRIFRRDAR